MSRLIIMMIIIIVVSQLVGWVRRKQREDQRGRRPSAATDTKTSWEDAIKKITGVDFAFEEMKQTPASEGKVNAKMSLEQSEKTDDEFRLVSKPTPDEEKAFKAETVAQTRPSEDRGTVPRVRKPSVPPKHKPIQIAGIPLTSQTISQGVIISEILRRPEF